MAYALKCYIDHFAENRHPSQGLTKLMGSSPWTWGLEEEGVFVALEEAVVGSGIKMRAPRPLTLPSRERHPAPPSHQLLVPQDEVGGDMLSCPRARTPCPPLTPRQPSHVVPTLQGFYVTQAYISGPTNTVPDILFLSVDFAPPCVDCSALTHPQIHSHCHHADEQVFSAALAIPTTSDVFPVERIEELETILFACWMAAIKKLNLSNC
ncbi:hypothetical protein BDK51DRAFT_36991 [Blyttiomyces helicus]|uniref:Uncharacterized protein n=1 Tax=Blyttiomyces helicus TaxID=388810 RepID=A0A4P9W1S8_9FUNG|nr:hypothetical protein BDK51DRAFT_36991 [Blyttiomyces helicus]|eukprot:RKO86151.1 hypothetical protein BDK51DRAFT_36991 [Blyttiomyces helicus]